MGGRREQTAHRQLVHSGCGFVYHFQRIIDRK
jgi:hypothetical protein